MLTKRQIEILQLMVDNEDTDDGELVLEKGEAWIGLEKTSPKTVFNLLRAMVISQDQYSVVGGFERYHINSTGKEYLQKLKEK